MADPILPAKRTDPLRVPPHSIDAEQAVLGGLMIANDKLTDVAELLTDADFYRRDHGLIFRAISEQVSAGNPADAVTLGEWFEAQGIAELVGGSRYILEMANTTPSAANIVAYAEIVREKSALRKLIDVGTEMAGKAFDAKGAPSADIAAQCAGDVLAIAGSKRMRGPRTMREIGKSWYARLVERMDNRSLPGIPTPWGSWNERTGGLQPGMLYVTAARPSIGKTVWVENVLTPAALAGHPVMLFSMEQSGEQLFTRAACAQESVNTRWCRDPKADDDLTLSKLSRAVSKLRDAPIIIDDASGATWQQLKLRAKRQHMRQPLKIIGIDHLHIMRVRGKDRLDIELGEISREMKALAVELQCAVVLLAQLNRSLEQRANKRPIMSDLRECGGLEQDADVITFLYRDDYYAEQEQRASEYPGVIEMNVAKWRDGQTGVCWGSFRGEYSRIDNLDHAPARIVQQQPERKGRKHTYRPGGE